MTGMSQEEFKTWLDSLGEDMRREAQLIMADYVFREAIDDSTTIYEVRSMIRDLYRRIHGV